MNFRSVLLLGLLALLVNGCSTQQTPGPNDQLLWISATGVSVCAGPADTLAIVSHLIDRDDATGTSTGYFAILRRDAEDLRQSLDSIGLFGVTRFDEEANLPIRYPVSVTVVTGSAKWGVSRLTNNDGFMLPAVGAMPSDVERVHQAARFIREFPNRVEKMYGTSDESLHATFEEIMTTIQQRGIQIKQGA